MKQRDVMGWAVVVLVLCGAIGAGCSQETVDSARKDISRNTESVRESVEKVEKAAEPMIEVAKPVVMPMVDAVGRELNKKKAQLEIGARVTAALQANANLPKGIRVDADPDARGIKLRGTVKTIQQKKLAGRIAQDTLGKDKKIQNDLTIGDPAKKEKTTTEKPTKKKS